MELQENFNNLRNVPWDYPPWDYPWSSARVHVENDADDQLVDLRSWRLV